MMMPAGIRIAVNGEGDEERFTVIEFPSTPKGPGHFMSTSQPMTEAEFRAWLAAGGIEVRLIDETVAGARGHPRA